MSGWLSDYEHQGVEPPGSLPEADSGPRITEPPISQEDSSSYPATAALNAITGLEKDDYSLSLLLEQIERQLPADAPDRPQLKPLPSWGSDARKVEAMFDHFEGPMPPVQVQPDSTIVIPEPDSSIEQTRPSPSMLEEIDRVPVQDIDTVPTTPERSDEAWPHPSTEEVSEDDYQRIRTVADRLAEEISLDEQAAAEAFYAGIQQPEGEEVYDEEPTYDETPFDEEDLVYANLPPDQDHLVPIPVESLTMMLQEEDPIEETTDDQLAQIAVQLTQFSLESSAHATLLSRPGQLLAHAGELPPPALERLFQAVDTAWQTSLPESGALVRYIKLPEIGEFLLYSSYVMEDLILSMAFRANTSMRTMRRQARRLSESLAFVPEESEADSTLPSRPTDLRPPAGLHEAVSEPDMVDEGEPIEAGEVIEEAQEADEVEEPERPPRPEGPYTAYTCLWLLKDPGQELHSSVADELVYWIGTIAEENAWDIDYLDIQADYVMVSLQVPHKTLPDNAISLLMEETALRCAEYYPDEFTDPYSLWADGYYVVTPPRALTEREIARFITYQRQAQIE
jgi:hypothetical protein